ncbi:MAG TPA: methyltransferase, partial [Rhodospirillales bacterium]|nr:methyltransferase [Rhodospirillales bacterium]
MVARRARRKRETADFKQLPYKQPRNPYQPFNILSDDQIEDIHQTSLKVLSEIGINFLCPEARDILQSAGA